MPSNVSSSLTGGFKVLGVSVRRQPRLFAIATVGAVVFGALQVSDAWVLGWATDHAIIPGLEHSDGWGDAPWGALLVAAALFVGVALLRGAGVLARRVGAGIMQYRLMADDRRDITRQYLDLPLSWHQKHPTGQLLSVANADTEASWSLIAPFPMALGTIATMVVAVVLMFLADPVVAIAGVLVFPLVVIVNVGYQRVQSPLITRAQALRAEVSEVAHESFDGATVVKTLGREAQETRRFAVKSRQLQSVNIKIGIVRAVFDPLIEALPTVGVLAVLIVGALRVRADAANPGDVVQIAYLLSLVTFSIRSIGWLVGEFPRSVVGFGRVQAILDARSDMPYGDQRLVVADKGARLDLRNVGYGYDDERTVLDDVTFSVDPGRTIALVGATASGKSTLTNLVLRLVDPARGAIELDGVDLRSFARGALAEHVALVAQQAFLFDDTIRGNVTLDVDVPDEQIWDALRVAQADGFIAALPHGLDSRLGERGTTLSGGQRQRLSLARALVRDPRLLVMDDATSAVDPEVEARILHALQERSGASVLVVAYRKATIALADEVVFLHGGRIHDIGTHAELVSRNPAYADLVNAYEVVS